MKTNILEFIIKFITHGSGEISKVERQTTNLKNSVGNLCNQWTSLRNIAASWFGARYGIDAFNNLIQSANNATMAIRGLEYTALTFGQSQSKVTEAARELSKDGLMNLKDSAEGLKFLLSSGFNISEALQIGKAFKDIGAFNNVVGDLGQAFKDSSKGIKTGSIELIENIGFTQRLSTVMKNANIDISNGIDITNNLSQRRVLLNAITNEGIKFQGNANKLASDGVGIQKRLGIAIENLKSSLGKIVLIGLNPIIKNLGDDTENLNKKIKDADSGLKNILNVIGGFINLAYNMLKVIIRIGVEFSGFVKIIGTFSAVLISIIAVIKIYTTIMGVASSANIAFVASLTPFAAIITVFVGALGMLFLSISKHKNEMEELNKLNLQYNETQNLNIKKIQDEHYWNLKKAESLEKLIEKYKELKDKGDNNTSSQSDLKKVLKQIEENYPELISKTNQYGEALEINMKTAETMSKRLREMAIKDLEVELSKHKINMEKAKKTANNIAFDRSFGEAFIEMTTNQMFKYVKNIPNAGKDWPVDIAYESVLKDKKERKSLILANETYLKAKEQADLVQSQIDVLRKTDTLKYEPGKDTTRSGGTSKSTALERINYALEKWYVLDTKKTAADEQILSKYKELGKKEKIEKEPEAEKIKYYGKLFDYEKNTEKFKSELEKKQKEIKDESFEFITKAMLPEDTAQLEIDKYNLKNKYETVKSKFEKEGMTAPTPALDTAYQVEIDKLNKNYELKQIEKQAAARDYINQRTMGEDTYRFQKLRDEENKNYKERKDDYLNYTKDKEEIDAAHEKNLKRISDEETEYKKKKLEEDKQTLNNYLKENKEYQKQILQEELDNERDVLLKKYENNVEVQEMIKKVYAEKSEALKEQFRDYTNFTAAELMRLLELETTTAEQREKINKALNEKLRSNNITASEAFETGWQRAVNNFKTLSEIIEQAGSDMANALQNGISGFIQDAIKNVTNLKDAWINFSHSMRDAFVKAIAEMIVAEMKLTSVKNIIGGALGFVGGLFGIGGGSAVSEPIRVAAGGLVTGAGTGTSDDIFAKLSNGEFVVNALMTQKFRPLLEAINSNKIPRFAKGGIAGGSAGSASGQYGAGNQEMNIQINNIFDAANVFMRGLMSNRNTVLNMIADEAQKNVRFRAALAGR